MGISTAAVQQFGFAAEASGQSADQVTAAMGRLQVTAANAATAGGASAAAFEKLGVHVKDANGHLKNADVLFTEVAEGISKQGNATERAQLATELFGKSGRELLPILTKGAAGVEELRAEFEALGGGFDEEAFAAGEDFTHQLARINLVWKSIQGTIARGLLPVLTAVVRVATTLAGWFNRMAQNTNIVRNGIIALGIALSPLMIEMALAFAPLLLAIAGVAALILFVDDLITLFEGGQSVIGDAIDSIWGAGSQKKAQEFLKTVVDGFKEVLGFLVDDVWPWVKKIFGFIDRTMHAVSDIVVGKAASGGGVSDQKKEAIRAKAAAQGRPVQFADETREDAMRAMNLSRKMQGLGPVEFGPAGPPGPSAPSVASAGPRTGGVVSQQNNVTINVDGSKDPKAVADEVGKKLDAHHDEKVKEAHYSLTQAAGG